MEDKQPYVDLGSGLIEDLRTFRGGGSVDDDRLRKALAALCADARSGGMLPERLVILVKELWAAQPGSRDISNAGFSGERLSRVVTMLLDEYFREPHRD